MSYQEAMYLSEQNGIEIGEIIGAIKTYFKFGKSVEETISGIKNDFSLTNEAAEEYVRKYRPAAN